MTRIKFKPILVLLVVFFFGCHYDERNNDIKKPPIDYNFNYRFYPVNTKLFLERMTIPVEVFALSEKPPQKPYALPIFFSRSLDTAGNDTNDSLKVPLGYQLHCILYGSEVWLDAGSKLTTSSFSNPDGIFTLSGELHLQTAGKQWQIKADDMTIKVQPETEINIKNCPNGKSIIVHLSSGAADLSAQDDHFTLVNSGDLVIHAKNAYKHFVQSNELPGYDMAWTQGILCGKEDPDPIELANNFSRLYNTTLCCKECDSVQSRGPYSIPFRYMSLKEILDVFKSDFKLYPTFSQDTIYLALKR